MTLAGPVFLLEVPSSTDHLPTSRAFAAAVARRHAVPEETIEDLKLAVSETMTEALEAGADHITLAATIADGRLTFTLSPLPTEVDERAMGGVELVKALFPHSGRHGFGLRIAVDL